MDKEEFLEIVEKVITHGNGPQVARAMAQLFGTIAKNFVKDTLTGSILLTLHEDHIELVAFNVDEDEATIIDTRSPDYHTIKYSYDLTEVWHIVVAQAPSTNATWDRFLSDLSDLYPADPADSATDEELAHAGVRLR